MSDEFKEDRVLPISIDKIPHWVTRSSLTGYIYVGNEYIGGPKDALKVAIAILTLLEGEE